MNIIYDLEQYHRQLYKDCVPLLKKGVLQRKYHDNQKVSHAIVQLEGLIDMRDWTHLRSKRLISRDTKDLVYLRLHWSGIDGLWADYRTSNAYLVDPKVDQLFKQRAWEDSRILTALKGV